MQTQEHMRAAPTVTGRVEGIFIGPAEGAPMIARDIVRIVAGRGIEGDRYFDGHGHYSHVPPLTGRRLTLIAAEDLEAMTRETGIALLAQECRRNLVTRGVDLDALVGTRFRIGAVECYGERFCPPCGYLEALLGRPGLNRAMTDRGGIRAEVLLDGELRIGDEIAPSSIVP